MSSDNAFLPRKIVGNMALYVVAQTDTLNPLNQEESGDLSAVAEEQWMNVAACKQAQYAPDTEDDAEDFFDAATQTRVKASNTQISGRTWTFDLERYALAFEAMYQGIKDPLSTATLEAMKSGEPVRVYATNSPYIPVGAKLCMYDSNRNLLKTQYFYGNLRCDGDQTFDGKILRPKAVLEVEASVHNTAVFAPGFSGATAAS